MAFTSSINNTGYGSSEDENASHQLLRAGTSHNEMWDNEDSSVDHNDELSEYEQYGTTPPRTRILRRNRERKQRDLKEYSWYLIFQDLYTLVNFNLCCVPEEMVDSIFCFILLLCILKSFCKPILASCYFIESINYSFQVS
ncbi:hypothetical protein ILUMI_05448 [Ignelater luminosus]|uniref:Uncharacterized protein n=1 Tax=Ignelater luminosus TaxID=2038154 RepID=A0A8K0DB24_IGNLU|nr:hypothetical protein ILUMI_05448 [Ignelater luminosus]